MYDPRNRKFKTLQEEFESMGLDPDEAIEVIKATGMRENPVVRPNDPRVPLMKKEEREVWEDEFVRAVRTTITEKRYTRAPRGAAKSKAKREYRKIRSKERIRAKRYRKSAAGKRAKRIAKRKLSRIKPRKGYRRHVGGTDAVANIVDQIQDIAADANKGKTLTIIEQHVMAMDKCEWVCWELADRFDICGEGVMADALDTLASAAHAVAESLVSGDATIDEMEEQMQEIVAQVAEAMRLYDMEDKPEELEEGRLNITDDTLRELIDMAGETSELPGAGHGGRNVKKIPSGVTKEFAKYEKDLEREMGSWGKKNAHAFASGNDAGDMFNDDGSYLVFMTLNGSGRTFLDGDWDHYFKDGDPGRYLDDLEKHLERKLGKYVDDTGGGSLNDALMDAAYEVFGEPEEGREEHQKKLAELKGNPPKIQSKVGMSKATRVAIRTLTMGGVRSGMSVADAVAALKDAGMSDQEIMRLMSQGGMDRKAIGQAMTAKDPYTKIKHMYDAETPTGKLMIEALFGPPKKPVQEEAEEPGEKSAPVVIPDVDLTGRDVEVTEDRPLHALNTESEIPVGIYTVLTQRKKYVTIAGEAGSFHVALSEFDLGEEAPGQEEIDESSLPNGKVATFAVVLTSILTRYDQRISKGEAKRGRVNIYRLGHLLGAAHKAEEAARKAKIWDSDNPEDLEKYRKMVTSQFVGSFPPINRWEKKLDEFIKNGKLPSLKSDVDYTDTELKEATNFDSAEEFTDFLKNTLIPDLKRSGMKETAKDFEKCVKLIKSGKRDKKFERFLKGTLVPDLRDSGMDATADDFEEALYWMGETEDYEIDEADPQAVAKKMVKNMGKKPGDKGYDALVKKFAANAAKIMSKGKKKKEDLGDGDDELEEARSLDEAANHWAVLAGFKDSRGYHIWVKEQGNDQKAIQATYKKTAVGGDCGFKDMVSVKNPAKLPGPKEEFVGKKSDFLKQFGGSISIAMGPNLRCIYQDDVETDNADDSLEEAGGKGSGPGQYKADKRITTVKGVKKDQLVICKSLQFGATNVARVTKVDRAGWNGIFVNPKNPTEKRMKSDQEFHVWDFEMVGDNDHYYSIKGGPSVGVGNGKSPKDITDSVENEFKRISGVKYAGEVDRWWEGSGSPAALWLHFEIGMSGKEGDYETSAGKMEKGWTLDENPVKVKNAILKALKKLGARSVKITDYPESQGEFVPSKERGVTKARRFYDKNAYFVEFTFDDVLREDEDAYWIDEASGGKDWNKAKKAADTIASEILGLSTGSEMDQNTKAVKAVMEALADLLEALKITPVRWRNALRKDSSKVLKVTEYGKNRHPVQVRDHQSGLDGAKRSVPALKKAADKEDLKGVYAAMWPTFQPFVNSILGWGKGNMTARVTSSLFDVAHGMRDLVDFVECVELQEELTLGKKDKAVIDAFTSKKSMEGNKLSSDGKKLDGHWMGGNKIAWWEGGKIHFGDLGSRAAQTVQRAIKKNAAPNDLAEDKQVAATILKQLGGAGKVKAMLGVKQFIAGDNFLQFKWPNKQRSRGNVVIIRLRPDDTYDMEFYNNTKLVKKFEMVYFDQLIDLFEQQTGWYLRMDTDEAGNMNEGDSPDMIKLREIGKKAKKLSNQLFNTSNPNLDQAEKQIIKMAKAALKLDNVLFGDDKEKMKELAAGKFPQTAGNPVLSAAARLAKIAEETELDEAALPKRFIYSMRTDTASKKMKAMPAGTVIKEKDEGLEHQKKRKKLVHIEKNEDGSWTDKNTGNKIQERWAAEHLVVGNYMNNLGANYIITYPKGEEAELDERQKAPASQGFDDEGMFRRGSFKISKQWLDILKNIPEIGDRYEKGLFTRQVDYINNLERDDLAKMFNADNIPDAQDVIAKNGRKAFQLWMRNVGKVDAKLGKGIRELPEMAPLWFYAIMVRVSGRDMANIILKKYFVSEPEYAWLTKARVKHEDIELDDGDEEELDERTRLKDPAADFLYSYGNGAHPSSRDRYRDIIQAMATGDDETLEIFTSSDDPIIKADLDKAKKDLATFEKVFKNPRKVTIYFSGGMGGIGIGKLEGKLIAITGGNMSGPGGHVYYLKKGGKNIQILMPYYSPFWVIADGWNQPNPDDPFVTVQDTPEVTVRKGRYMSADPRWEQEFLDGVAKKLKVLAQLRDKKMKVFDKNAVVIREDVRSPKEGLDVENPELNEDSAGHVREMARVLINAVNKGNSRDTIEGLVNLIVAAMEMARSFGVLQPTLQDLRKGAEKVAKYRKYGAITAEGWSPIKHAARDIEREATFVGKGKKKSKMLHHLVMMLYRVGDALEGLDTGLSKCMYNPAQDISRAAEAARQLETEEWEDDIIVEEPEPERKSVSHLSKELSALLDKLTKEPPPGEEGEEEEEEDETPDDEQDEGKVPGKEAGEIGYGGPKLGKEARPTE